MFVKLTIKLFHQTEGYGVHQTKRKGDFKWSPFFVSESIF